MEFERFNNIFNQLIGNYLGFLRPTTVEIIFKHLNSYLSDMQMQQDKGEAKRKFMHHYWLKSLFMCGEDELKTIIKQHLNKKLEEGLNYLLSIYYWKMSYKQIANKEFLWHDFVSTNGAYGSMQLWWLHRQMLKNGFKELLSTEFERGLPWKRGTKISYNKIKAFYFDYYLERELDEQAEDAFSEVFTFICAVGPVINKYNIHHEATEIINYMVENVDKFYFQSPVKFLIAVKDIKYPREKAWRLFVKFLHLYEPQGKAVDPLAAILGIMNDEERMLTLLDEHKVDSEEIGLYVELANTMKRGRKG